MISDPIKGAFLYINGRYKMKNFGFVRWNKHTGWLKILGANGPEKLYKMQNFLQNR